MLRSLIHELTLLMMTLLIISLISYVILLQDPLNTLLSEPNCIMGYVHYVINLLYGDFGISYNGGQLLHDTLLTVLPTTLELCFCAILLALLFGIPLGLLGALNQYKFFGKITRTLSLLGLATPVFWLAPILLYVAAIYGWEISAIGQYNLLYEIQPITGFPMIDVWFIDAPYRLKAIQNVYQHLALPTIVLMILPTMEIINLTQQRAEQVFNQNYSKIAVTRGWSKFKILHRYVLRNTFPAIIPQMPRLFTLVIAQCMLVESSLGWPGIGRWLIDAVSQQDYNSIAAGIIAIALCILLVRFTANTLTFLLDPLNKKGWYAR